MTKEEFQKLLQKHLKGETTQEERKQIDQFTDHFYHKYGKSIFSSEKEKEDIYRELRARVTPVAGESFKWFRIAAALLVLIGLGFGYFSWNNSFNSTETVTTAVGEIITLTLSDGSIVQLNAGSKLEYPKEFGRKREVKLQGEAYFKIAKDSAHPFEVDAGGIKTTVLGTEFNLSAYPEDSLTILSLVEGAIKVDGFNQTHLLKPRQQARFKWQNKSVDLTPFKVDNTLAWREHILVFQRTEFRQFAKIVKRTYGVVLVFDDPDFNAYTVNGRLENADLALVLTAVTKAKGLEYKKINDEQYLIYKPGSK